ncbi:MAG: pyridoxamine 5'-phosphate oxidase family protein, partial [Alicyclobacillaceae bacterium]|nr:pyridoxamine 5'-phosphate oxidase family protein [Alicyclobacillaceae bacterium]
MDCTSKGMRREKKAVRAQEQVDEFLETAHVGCLGLVDGDEPYVVPLNYVWLGGCIYFHGAGEGRKARLMKEAAKATFSVAQEMGIVPKPVPCDTGTAYMSVMIFGMVERVTDLEEASSAMAAMLDKYMPGYFSNPLHKGHVQNYMSGSGSHTHVYRLRADKVTAKQDLAELEELHGLGPLCAPRPSSRSAY